MTEYKLVVEDASKPESRLTFINRLEGFLAQMKEAGLIEKYALYFDKYDKLIFKVEVDF